MALVDSVTETVMVFQHGKKEVLMAGFDEYLELAEGFVVKLKELFDNT